MKHPIYQPEEDKQFRAGRFPDLNRVVPLNIARWQAFAAGGRTSPATTIMESTLLQLQLGFGLKMNVDRAAIERHMRQVEAAIETLAPVLIYFYQEDIRKSLTAVWNLRREEFFAENTLEGIASTPYGRANGVRDLEGVLAFFEDFRDTVRRVLDDLRMPKLVIENQAGDWQRYERQITDFLDLPAMAAAYPPANDAERFAGRYRAAGTGGEFEVVVQGDAVFLNGQHPTRLIPKQGAVFYVEGTPLEISFEVADRGTVTQLVLDGNLEIPDRVYTRCA